MANVMIDHERLQSAISGFDKEINNLKELFDEQDKNFKILTDDGMWLSESKESCLNKYEEVSKQYEDIITGLTMYKQFIVNVDEAYKAFDEKMSGQFASYN